MAEAAKVPPEGEKPLSTADIGSAAKGHGRPVVRRAQSGQERARETTAEPRKEGSLFPADVAEDLQARWSSIQTAFVDEPRRAVEQADSLVAEVMKRLAEIFADERSELERQWDRGDEVSTEELRVAMQRYRSFFNRLLSM